MDLASQVLSRRRHDLMIERDSFEGLQHPMIDNTAIRDTKLHPPFMHTALTITLKLNYHRKTASRLRRGVR